jgi:hypothetical protein
MHEMQISDIIMTKHLGGMSMNSISRNSIIWAVVLLVEAIILQLAKSMRLWIYIALPIIAGFAAMELLKPQSVVKLIIPRPTAKKRVLR